MYYYSQKLYAPSKLGRLVKKERKGSKQVKPNFHFLQNKHKIGTTKGFLCINLSTSIYKKEDKKVKQLNLFSYVKINSCILTFTKVKCIINFNLWKKINKIYLLSYFLFYKCSLKILFK